MVIRNKILISYLAILSLGVAISAEIFLSGRDIDRITQELLDNKLPNLQLIATMRKDLTEHERILYEYYASFDRPTAMKKLQQLQQRLLS